MTIDQFGKALVASGLMTADDVKATWNAIPPESRPKDGATFGKLLVDKGLLTPFQVAELLAGRGARLMMGDYTIVSQIGAGGMGQVYKAQHRRMKRVVALKVMSNAAMQDEAAVKRFQREVHAAARLEHPNIVTAYDSGEAGSVKYLVMQFVDGGDLSDLVKKSGRLEIAQAVGYVIQAARGLAFAHGEGVIHRDIKPANLLLDKKGVVKILDMGLARFEDGGDGLTATEQVMGTVDYMSPEQAANTKGCDGRADIYSLGCTLWFLLTGKKLYEADTLIARLMLHRDGPLPSLVKERDDAPWPLEQALHKMIAKRAADRYQTMDEVVAALAPFGGDASLSGSLGGSGTSGGQSAELASFMQAMGSGGTKTSHPSATQMKAPAAKPATSANLEATAQLSAAEIGTDPKSVVLPKGATSPTATGKPQTSAKKSKPGGNRTKLIAAGALGGVLLLAGIIVTIRDKDGNVVAEVNAPTGVSAEVIATPQNVAKSIAPTIPFSPTSTLTAAQVLESPDYIWTTPENLGPAINGPGDQLIFSLTNDQHRLYFGRKGADGRTNDVLEVVRSSLTAPFSEPKVVGEASEAFVSGDGLTIMQAGPDISMKRRPTLDSAFGPADRLSQLNTPTSAERRPTLSPDGLTLVFSTDRAPDMKTDLWISRRNSQSESFGPAESIGPPVNTPGYEQFGTLLVENRTLIFVRTNDNGGWLMTTTNSFGKAVAVPLPNNPFGTTLNLWLAPDGRTAYFSADLSGGFGGKDIYVTRRVPKTGATPTPQALTAAQRLESPDYVWSEPENLGPNVNRDGYENLPTLTADQLDMIVEAGVESGSHLREFRRNSVDAPWGEGKQLLDGEHEDFPFLSRDGLTLIYSTKFPLAGHQGNFDLYERRRANRNAPWGPPRNLGPTINSPQDDTYGSLSPDGLSLAYSSERSASGHTKIWTARRASLDSPWEKPQEAAGAINVGGVRGPLWLDDGKTMIFHGPGGLRMTFASSTGAVSTSLLRIPHPFGQNTRISLSPDGQVAYFDADKPGGFGGRDIWVTRRVPKSGATPTIAATPSFIQSLPTTVPPGVQNLPAGKWGLRFEPGQFVEAGPAPYRDTTVVTTEIWLTDESDTTLNQSVLVGGPNGFIHTSQNDSLTMYTPHSGNPEPVAMPKNQRVHIAAVNDGRGRRLYVNGKLAASSDDAGSPTSGNRDKSLPIEISNKYRFRGVIDGVRISTTARYTADFTPDQTFTADKDTFAVYRFDEGQGNVLKDSSANGYHGRINGATWVRGGASAPPPATPSGSATSSLADRWPFDPADGKQYAWSAPENLGPAINTQGRNLLLGISDDELTIYLGGENLRTARRSSPQEPFGPPGPIPGLSDRCKGVISSNGLTAAFAEFRTAERAPVWLSARSSVDQPFSPPVKAEPPASDSNNGEGRALSPDGLTLAVNSNRNRGSADIWIFRRPALDQPFGSAERLAEPVSTPDWDIPYFISNDRCFLIAASQRGTGGSAERIVRYFRRAAENEPFGPGTEIELPLGSAKRSDSNGDFRLADGGRALYFSSYAVNGGHGDFDVWVCRRVSASGRPLVPSKPEDLRRLLDAKFEVVVRTPSPFGAEAIDSKLKSGDALPTGPATIVGLALGGTATPIDDALLGFVAGLTELEELRFEKGTHSFSAQGLRKLASLTHLRRLSLYNVGRHADGASDLLASLPHLEFLHIPYGTQIAGEWAAAAAVRPSIIEINAFRADFSDTGISPLEKMPQLQRLNLSDNAKLTQGAIDRLVAALPSCRIEYGSHSDKKIIEPRSSPAKAAAPQPGAPAVMQNGPPAAVFPFDAAAAIRHQEAWAKHLGVPVEFTNGVGMKFRLIPPGEFQMGLGPEFTDEELLRLNRGKDDQKLRGLRMARPAHPVRITRPFYMEVEEVTAGRYRDVVGQLRPEMEQDPNKVLGNLVAWPDAIAFCNKLSEREGKRPAYRIEGAQVTPLDDADGYRLPTEAQWEYACRAGTNTLWYFGSDGGADSNEFRKRCAAPNPFGLTGLYGGANEWCWDATHGNPYRAASVDRRDDPREDVGTSRIKRGGSGNDDSGGNRGAINSFVRIGTPGVPYSPDASRYTGFGRVVLPITAIARP